MQHNLSDETKRRISLCLATTPHHTNIRRVRFQERTVAVLMILGLIAWLTILASHITTAR